jgi:hypothetical protein
VAGLGSHEELLLISLVLLALLHGHIPILVLLVYLGVCHCLPHALTVPVLLTILTLSTCSDWKQQGS